LGQEARHEDAEAERFSVSELPINAKYKQSEVHFEAKSTHEPENCGVCKHLILAKPNRCEGVLSSPLPILPQSWCHRYRSKSHGTQ
jgi:hypothetical protein